MIRVTKFIQNGKPYLNICLEGALVDMIVDPSDRRSVKIGIDQFERSIPFDKVQMGVRRES